VEVLEEAVDKELMKHQPVNSSEFTKDLRKDVELRIK